jgi:hypothetical protein
MVLALAAAPAMASVLMSDNFDNYTPGTLAGQGGWAVHGNAGTTPLNVVPATIQPSGNEIRVVQGITTSAEDLNKLTGSTMGAGDKWYASFLVKVGGTVSASDYFAHFKNAANVFPTKIGVTTTTDAGKDFTFYVWQGSGSGPTGTGTGAVWPTGFTYGSVHVVVAAYENSTGRGELWVDPTVALGEASPKLDVTYANSKNANAVAYAFRQATLAAGTQNVDNLIVGTTFADVFQTPEPASLLVLGLGALIMVRRRR